MTLIILLDNARSTFSENEDGNHPLTWNQLKLILLGFDYAVRGWHTLEIKRVTHQGVPHQDHPLLPAFCQPVIPAERGIPLTLADSEPYGHCTIGLLIEIPIKRLLYLLAHGLEFTQPCLIAMTDMSKSEPRGLMILGLLVPDIVSAWYEIISRGPSNLPGSMLRMNW